MAVAPDFGVRSVFDLRVSRARLQRPQRERRHRHLILDIEGTLLGEDQEAYTVATAPFIAAILLQLPVTDPKDWGRCPRPLAGKERWPHGSGIA